jgi:predicted XRE-type DNA-binding protein
MKLEESKQIALGSSFDDFLEEQNMLSEVESLATKRVIAYQIQESMEQKKISKTEMAKRMGTSRSSLNRLLDPLNNSVSLATIESAVIALGQRLRIKIV